MLMRHKLIDVSHGSGRHVEEQLGGERTRSGERRRCLRGADGRYGRRLRDRRLRVRVEESAGSLARSGEWRKIARGRRSRGNLAGSRCFGIRRGFHAARSRRDLSRHTARIYQLMLVRWWSSSLMVSVQNDSGLIVRARLKSYSRDRSILPPVDAVTSKITVSRSQLCTVSLHFPSLFYYLTP